MSAPIFNFTVRDLVAMGRYPFLRALRGLLPSDWDAVDRALFLAGLDSLAERPIGELSGGERQRVAIGRSLINDPSLVLADEPTGNLDEENSQIVEELILELAGSLETSFVVVTHDEAFAQRLSKIFVLKSGKLSERVK